MSARPLVLIEWVDSHHRPGWSSEDPQSHLLKCRSVGWKVHEDKHTVVLAANMTVEEDSQRCGDMNIPRRSITKITKL